MSTLLHAPEQTTQRVILRRVSWETYERLVAEHEQCSSPHFTYDRWSPQQRVPRTEAWEVVPNLVVEVVSPTDRAEDLMDKVAEYLCAGVECVWVVFPSQEQIHVYESPTSVRILTRTDVLRGGPVLPHFQLPVAALFDEAEETGSSQPITV